MVELRGVSKVYARPGGGRIEALVDVSFTLGAGELAVLSGPSGAGKSTVLRLLAGEERPTGGTVRVGGEDVGALGRGGLARLRRRLGIVPQDGRLLADRTVFGNVVFVLRGLGTPRREIRPRALAALREAGLLGRLRARPEALAGGERERLLLARALALAPDLWLVDQPGALLGGAAADLEALLRAEQKRRATVLVTAPTPALAARLGGRSLVLEGGRVRVEGGPA